MLDSDVQETDIGGVLEAGLSATDGDLLFVNPSRNAIEALVTALERSGSPPTVRLFVDERALKELTEDFLIASAIAELVARDALSIRTLGSVPRSSMLLTEGFLVSIVASSEGAIGLTTTEQPFVRSVYNDYHDSWSRANSFDLRTPPLSRIRETLSEEIGESAVGDFDRTLETLETARGNGDGIDEVTIALLVAANNGELLYDISRWGEDIGLASKATFSRAKNQLEEHGLIETEKVPIDVGRPRLRLLPASGDPEDSSIETIIDDATSTFE